jgi:hypothetical protein
MSRGAHKLKQSDITKAVKGVEKASMKVHRVEIAADGRIVVITDDAGAGVVQRNSVNEWDSVK